MPRRPRRYVTRSPVCLERLTIRADGKIQYKLKNPYRFSPLDFLSKLAALIPRPRYNLVRYHGVLARGGLPPNLKLRSCIVPRQRKKPKKKEKSGVKDNASSTTQPEDDLLAPLTWAQRLKRVFRMMGPPPDNSMSKMRRNYAGYSRYH